MVEQTLTKTPSMAEETLTKTPSMTEQTLTKTPSKAEGTLTKTPSMASSFSLSSPVAAYAISALAVVLALMLLPFRFPSRLAEFPSRETHSLVIAVLSARGHFGLRNAIRDTWLRDINRQHKKNRVSLDFQSPSSI